MKKTVSAMENVKAMGIAEKTHLEKIAAIEKHIAHVKANITPVKKIECVYCTDHADMQKKKKYHAYLEKTFKSNNKAIDTKTTEKKSTVIPTSAEKLASAIAEQEKMFAMSAKCNKSEKIKTQYTTINNTVSHKNIVITPNNTEAKKNNKNLVKLANKDFKTIKENVKVKNNHIAEFIKLVQNHTTQSEIKAYQKQFKQVFETIVKQEYQEKLSQTSLRLSDLHEKQKRLIEKKKALDIKIKACESIITQLSKTDTNKINYSLIDNKLDIISITLSDYSLTKIQAVKSQLVSTLNNTISALTNTVNSIKELTNIDTAYNKILTGNEIIINITTAHYTNNVNFSVYVGYDCNNNNSTYAIKHIHDLTEQTLKAMNITKYFVDVNYNIFEYNEKIENVVLALSKQIVKRQAFNMIQRQGSKTQYLIYYSAMRNDFFHHDTSDILSAAYSQIFNTLSIKKPANILKAKNIITIVNAKIQHLNKYIDCHKIEFIIDETNRIMKEIYKIDFVKVTNDYNKNKSFLTLLENMYIALTEKSIKALKTSCYNAINVYLTSIRAIHEKTEIENIENEIDYILNSHLVTNNSASIANADNAEMKKYILCQCYKRTKQCITKSTAKTFDLMCKGYSEIQIAEKRKMQKSTISEHISEIKKAFMQSYITLTKSDNTEIKQAFENNVIVFDPSVFDDCKAISEKTEKIIDTYNKNIEVDRIKNAVGEMSAIKYADMQHAFITFVKSELRDIDIQIFSFLNDNTSVRDTAEKLSINMNVVKRTRIKIINKTLDIIERYAEITINKDSLKKVEFSTIIELIKTA